MIFDAGRGLAQNSSSWSGAMVNSTASHQAMVLLRGDERHCSCYITFDTILSALQLLQSKNCGLGSDTARHFRGSTTGPRFRAK